MYMSLRKPQLLQPPWLHNLLLNILQRATSSLLTLTFLLLTTRFPITDGTTDRAHLIECRIIAISLTINPYPIIRIRRLKKSSNVRLRSGIAICVLARRAHDIRARLGPQVYAGSEFLAARSRAGDRDAVAVDETDVAVGLIGIEGAFELCGAAFGVCFCADEDRATIGVIFYAKIKRTLTGVCAPGGLEGVVEVYVAGEVNAPLAAC